MVILLDLSTPLAALAQEEHRVKLSQNGIKTPSRIQQAQYRSWLVHQPRLLNRQVRNQGLLSGQRKSKGH